MIIKNFLELLECLRKRATRFWPSFRPLPCEPISGSAADFKKWLEQFENGQGAYLNKKGGYVIRRGHALIDLSGKNFSHTRFRNVEFGRVNFKGTSFVGTDLEGSDLSKAINLEPHALAGANLTKAILPEDFTWQEIEQVKELSMKCGSNFIALLVACVYIALSVLDTTDYSLLANLRTPTLPMFQLPVSIFLFFVAAPVLLLLSGIFFWLNLQSLWHKMALLPAKFQSGKDVNHYTYPWIVKSVARGHSKFLKKEISLADRFVHIAILFLTLWLVPSVLATISLKYLHTRDFPLIAYHIATATVAGFLALRFQCLTRTTLSHNDQPSGDYSTRHGFWSLAKYGLPAVMIMVILTSTIKYALSTPNGPGISPIAQAISVHIAFGPVSERPTVFKGVTQDDCNNVQGADLANSDKLEDADAHDVFLVNARLQNAIISRANLRSADLRGAHMESVIPDSVVDEFHYDSQFNPMTSVPAIKLDEDHKSIMNQAMLSRADLSTGAVLDHADMRFAHCDGRDFSGASFKFCVMNCSVLSAANLTKSRLDGAKLWEAHLEFAELNRSNEEYANMSRIFGESADFTNADMKCANLHLANLSYAILHGANLNSATLTKTLLDHADLTQTLLGDADLTGANLEKADLAHATMIDATLNKADLLSANLNGAGLSNAKLKGAKITNANLVGATLLSTDFRRANLSGATLADADLTGANLVGAKLIHTNLTDAHLSKTDLRNTDMRRANLFGADLSDATLGNADLRDTILRNAVLIRVNLTGANLTNAVLDSANLKGAILRNAKITEDQVQDLKLGGATWKGAVVVDDKGEAIRTL